MLMRPIQAHSCMFARAPVHACAPASRAHPLLQAIFSHAPSRVFQEPKTLPEYKHFEPSGPLNPSSGKKKFLLRHRHLEAGLFLALPRCAPPHIASPRLSHPSTCTPTLRISNLHKHLTWRLLHSLLILPSNPQGQTRRNGTSRDLRTGTQ